MGNSTAGEEQTATFLLAYIIRKHSVYQNNLPLPQLPSPPWLWFLGPPATLPLSSMLSSFLTVLNSALDGLVPSLGYFSVWTSPELSIPEHFLQGPACRTHGADNAGHHGCVLLSTEPLPCLWSPMPLGLALLPRRRNHSITPTPRSCPVPFGDMSLFCLIT